MKPIQPFSYVALHLRTALCTCMVTMAANDALYAASQTWSANVNSSWDTTTANWNGAVWTNGNDAVFGAAGAGTVTIAAGGIVANSLACNSPGYTVAGGDLSLGGSTPTITATADATITSWLYGSTGLTKAGAGTLTLAGTNRYFGNTVVAGGVLDLTGAIYNWGGNAADTITVSSGATLRLHDGGWDIGATGINGNFNNSNAALLIDGGTIEMAGNYDDSGRGFSIGAGGATLRVAQAGTTWGLQAAGRSWQTNGGLFGPVVDNSNLTLGGAGNGRLDIPIVGSGSLTKTGAGTWTLTGANSYTGATNVNAGTLAIGGASNTSSVGVAAGASLAVAGAGTAGQLTVSGTFALAGGSILNLDMAGVGASDRIQLTGAYAAPVGTVQINLNALAGFGNGTYNLITGAAGISAGSYTLTSTPAGYTCVLSASNGTLSLFVGQPPIFPNPGTPLGFAASTGGVVSYQVQAGNSPTSYSATGLPAGVTINANTGLISGTATTAGTYFTTVVASNTLGSATNTLVLLVPAAPGAPAPGNNPPAVVLDSGTSLTVQPLLDNTLKINPGKGFAEYWGPSGYTTNISGVQYGRCNWADIETAEGVYNWAPIDNMIATFAPYGKKIAYGVINTNYGVEYATPSWVFDAGAVRKTMPDPSSPSGTNVIPESWDDPVYLAKMKNFIAAFGARYNGNPNIAYLDVRNYGMCGEGNGTYTSGLTNVSSDSLQNNFFKPYVDAFPNTQLIALGMDWLYRGVFEYEVTQGVGRRIDGICWGVGNASECLVAYPTQPAVLEYWSSWPDTVAAGYDSPNTLMGFIMGARPSYLQFQPAFYDANPEFCAALGNLLGYHFVLQQAVIPKTITANVSFPLSLKWLNDGIAPIYEPCSVAVALLDANNNVAQKQWLTGANPAGWLPGVPTTENFNITFTTVPSGYKLALGLFARSTDANPTYKLGVQGKVNNGWYILSGTTNTVAAKWTNTAGGSWNGANWSGFASHTGIDVVADLSTLNLTANATVTLDGAVTLGGLVLGDTTPSHNWVINTGTGGSLTLQSSPGSLPSVTVNNQTTTINTTLAGNQGLVKNGSGTLVLNGPNTYLGNTTINGGVLEVTTNTSLYNVWAGGAVTINTGSTLQLDGWVGYAGPATGDINQSDASIPNNLVVNGGTLKFVNVWGWNQASPRALAIGANGATLMNASTNAGLWQLSLAGNSPQDTLVDNSSLTLNGAVGTVSQLDKAITGSGSLGKTGTGTWTITRANTFSGATSVSAGKLTLTGSVSNTSSVTVAAGSTLEVSGNLHAVGNITNNGTLTFSGAAQFGAGGTITNNGTIINNSPSLVLPANIVNNGTILNPPPPPWQKLDIGTVGVTGTSNYYAGTFTVAGGGAGITGSADAFCYTYQTSSGDCSVVAKVAAMTNTNTAAKAGVMIRNTTLANSMEAGVWVTPGSGIIFTYRTTTGGTTTTKSSTGKVAPYWVKITRTGNSFAGYYSSNGTTWTQLGTTQTISMATSATIGLGVTSNVAGTLCTATLNSVTATP